ncbi:hypothetical protein N483_21295 [Pseudoalteromonas luteoviolacea NCIMB 1944]|nr:hypothetical protein N483_21295 [Pseudoalteromonas luteoviolacea NCIMB 1944]
MKTINLLFFVKNSKLNLTILELRGALKEASYLLVNAGFTNPAQVVYCTQNDFDSGSCFALSCFACVDPVKSNLDRLELTYYVGMTQQLQIYNPIVKRGSRALVRPLQK